MKLKTITDEDFLQYKVPCMYLATIYCTGKCCWEAEVPLSICLNDTWHDAPTLDIPDDEIIERYLSNNITKAICFSGLEPFEQFPEMYGLISRLRTQYNCNDTVVIYTGYNPREVNKEIDMLKDFKNIIVKFGRYIPNSESIFDEMLGVTLASDNQFAEKIS